MQSDFKPLIAGVISDVCDIILAAQRLFDLLHRDLMILGVAEEHSFVLAFFRACDNAEFRLFERTVKFLHQQLGLVF